MKAIGGDSNKMPAEILADQRRLEDAKKKSANLLAAVENGGGQIQILTQRLTEVQTEIVALEKSIAERENRKRAPTMLPSADWLQAELSNLPTLLNDGMPCSALLLRKIVERVTVHSIIPPGKKKGWGELEFRINTWNILAEVLGDKLPQSFLPTQPEMERVFRVPLGGPTRMDRWAPEIISMRHKGMTWKEIGRVTGLKPANAHSAYKRLTVLTNGNYVVCSPNWHGNGTGAATWCDGTIGLAGTVSGLNSLVSAIGDNGVAVCAIALSNGNYVVCSPNWSHGRTYYTGAVTWASGTSGLAAEVSGGNSLIGFNYADGVGGLFGGQANGVVALTNGNYVVCSPNWSNGNVSTHTGAATWADGTKGITGAITSVNSLVGNVSSDNVGSSPHFSS